MSVFHSGWFWPGGVFWEKQCSSDMCAFKLNTSCNVREVALQDMQYCVFSGVGCGIWPPQKQLDILVFILGLMAQDSKH